MSNATTQKIEHPKLGQLAATAISGNDILSSALYVSGIAAIFAGVYAPLVLLIVAGVLFLYKSVYTEVVEALPVNGGAYNCLLNGTSKTIAAIAGVTTFLSYIATAVISAKVGMEYLSTIVPVPVMTGTILLLLLFALLVVSGIKDSANVAIGIFILHIITLTTFVVLGALFYLNGGSHFVVNLALTRETVITQGGLLQALYLAFAASLLGVSGFESSANFVEEQKDGVFRKTLRNMLIGVAIFNPLIALVVVNAMPLPAIAAAKDFLLAHASNIIRVPSFRYLVAIDALLVLAGAVLTAYVGVSGLIHRMAGDSCIPHWFAKPNKRGSFPRIVFTFFALCTSILLLTGGNLLSLAGVYTIAFLAVMTSFAFGNLVLKETRRELKRTYKAPIFVVLLAGLATLFGVIGNIRIDAENLTFFELYFFPAVAIVLGVVYQDHLINFALRFTKRMPRLHDWLLERFSDLAEGRLVSFIRQPNRIYEILEYIHRNEIARKVTLVHCKDPEAGVNVGPSTCSEIQELVGALQRSGAFTSFTIDVLHKDRPFGPALISELTHELKIHTSRMLIGSIHSTHEFNYEELGGVRVIF